MAHDVSHGSFFRVSGVFVCLVDGLEEVVAEGEALSGYILFCPYFELKIWV